LTRGWDAGGIEGSEFKHNFLSKEIDMSTMNTNVAGVKDLSAQEQAQVIGGGFKLPKILRPQPCPGPLYTKRVLDRIRKKLKF
jgi:hypothetical protein